MFKDILQIMAKLAKTHYYAKYLNADVDIDTETRLVYWRTFALYAFVEEKTLDEELRTLGNLLKLEDMDIRKQLQEISNCDTTTRFTELVEKCSNGLTDSIARCLLILDLEQFATKNSLDPEVITYIEDIFLYSDAEKNVLKEVKDSAGKTESEIFELVRSSFERNRKFTINGIDMAFVEAGTFTMGSSDSVLPNETPHTVTLTKDYWIGKYEVTQEQYEAVMGTNPSRFKKGAKYPVEEVSWNDAQDFCKKLNSKLSSRLPVGYEFRLPTEAEWEYAARGGKKSKGYKYSGSNDVGSVAWYDDNSGRTTHPVGDKLPNELGIYDMSGNVWEWCLDYCNWNIDSGVETDTYRNNIQDPLCTTGSDRVRRGGDWGSIAGVCRMSDRGCDDPSGGSYDLGFRLALAPCR